MQLIEEVRYYTMRFGQDLHGTVETSGICVVQQLQSTGNEQAQKTLLQDCSTDKTTIVNYRHSDNTNIC